MKKTLSIVCAIVILSVVGSSFAYAADPNVIAPFNTGDMKSPIDSTAKAYSLLITIVRWVYTIFFVVAVLFILFAAYNFILGGKDEAKVKLAKSQLKYAIIAIAIALISAGVTTVINNFLEERQATAVPPSPEQGGLQ